LLINKQNGFGLLELMLAMSLSVLLCIGVFHIFSTLQNLHHQEMILSSIQEKTRFLSGFLREKIEMAGDWSCLSKSPGSQSLSAKGYDSDAALEKLGLSIKSKTDLLQLHECIRLYDRMQYLPVEFFVANTFRVDDQHHEIDALFFKVGHHPREELITHVDKFNILFGIESENHKNIISYVDTHSTINKEPIGAIKINYHIVADENLSQSGVLYAAIQKAE